MSKSNLDRKALKRPDEFVKTVRGGFESLQKSSKSIYLGVGVLVALGAAGAVYSSQRNAKEAEARDALFSAQNALEEDLKGRLSKLQDAADAKAKKTKKKKKAKPAPPVELGKLNVDQELVVHVTALENLVQSHSGTRAAFDAMVALGDLYAENENHKKAAEWFDKAAQESPEKFDRAMVLYSLAYAYENSGQCQKAVPHYETAANLNEKGIQGDLLLGLARCHEELKQVDQAKAAYDRILKLLPDTEYARSAELYRSQI